MAGFIALYNTIGEKPIMDSMLDTIKHRGKDYRLDYTDETLNLSYVGLDINYEFDGKELFEKDDYLVLLNGYMTNIDEVKEYCRRRYGINSNDFTPSQMILLIYEKEKLKVCDILKGGYIVIIYNKKNKEIIFIRDRFGIQPIYYYRTDMGIIFTSEVKALLRHPDFKKELNKDALLPYLVFQSPISEENFFKGVHSIKEASYLIYDGNKINEKEYWDVIFEPEDISLEDAADEINRLLGKSLENKLKYFKDTSNIGQSLSGGVDSSYLASRFRPNKTFTVGYSNKEFSEIDNAKALSEIIGAEHIAELIDSDIVFTEIDKIAYLCDMPFANLSAIPMYYLSKRINKDTNVVLSGEGSDEFFGGYFEYTEPKYMNIYKHFPKSFRRFMGNKMLKNDNDFKGKNFLIKGLPVEDWYLGQAKIFYENEARNILKDDFKPPYSIKDITSPYFDKVKGLSDIQKKQYLDMHIWMINDIQLKADRMNIGNSVQLLTPILDEDILDFARKLPDDLKINGDKVKIAFRKASEKYLPEDWAKRKKMGYVVPLKYWLKEEKYSKYIKEKLSSDLAKEFFNVDLLNELIEMNESGKRPEHRKIWTVYMFLLWYEEYFINR